MPPLMRLRPARAAGVGALIALAGLVAAGCAAGSDTVSAPPSAAPTSKSTPTATSSPDPVLPQQEAPASRWAGVACEALLGDAVTALLDPVLSGDSAPDRLASGLPADYQPRIAADIQAGTASCHFVDGAGGEVWWQLAPGAAEFGRHSFGDRLNIDGERRETDDAVVVCSRFAGSFVCGGDYAVGEDWVTLSYRGKPAPADLFSVGDEIVAAAESAMQAIPARAVWQRPTHAWELPASCDGIDPDGAAAAAAGLPPIASGAREVGALDAELTAYTRQGLLMCQEGDPLAGDPDITGQVEPYLAFDILPGAAWAASYEPDAVRTREVEVPGAPLARFEEASEGGGVLDVFTTGGWMQLRGADADGLVSAERLIAAATVLLERVDG